MKLANLLANLDDDGLQRLAQEHVRTDEPISRASMLAILEKALRGYVFLQKFISNRQPPAFAIMTLLLEAPDCTLPIAGFEDAVLKETTRLSDLVTQGEIVGRDDQLRLYRRVLYAVRRSDLSVDASENEILGVLRRELDIVQVEHFLIEHHSELQEFWNKDQCFHHEINALRTGGVVFTQRESVHLAEDVTPLIRQVLGIEMPREHAGRLYAQLGGDDLYNALAAAHVKTSGTKEDRVERLLQHMVQPRTVLSQLDLRTLRELCRDNGASVSGSKDDLLERLIQHFAAGRDQVVEEPRPVPISEERVLSEERFRLLFGSLRGIELVDILRALPELRQSGSKDLRIATLWNARRAEESLLGLLTGRDLETILARLELRISGSKTERIGRIINHFAHVDPTKVVLSTSDALPEDASSEKKTLLPPSRAE
jgi:hypothetical protein